MNPAAPQVSLLPIAVGIVELVIGCLAQAAPGAFDAPVYRESVGRVSRYATALVAGGVFTLLSYAAKTRGAGRVSLACGFLGALPLIAIGAIALIQAGLWASAFVGLVLGAGVLVDAARPSASGGEGRRPLPTFPAVMAALAAIVGALAVLAPSSLRVPGVSVLAVHAMRLGAGLLAATGLLLLGLLWPRVRPAVQALAALPFLALAAGLVDAGRWPGGVTYALLGAALAAEPALVPILRRRWAQRLEEPRGTVEYELATEATAWGVVLVLALAASVGTPGLRRFELAVIVLLASVFTVAWFHVRSVRGAGPQATVAAAAIYSALVTAAVTVTGGMTSPLFLLNAIPIIALAWTRVPKSIFVPTAIPLAALVAQGTRLLRLGEATPALLLSVAVPRAVGLLLVSGLSYMLARRNLEEQSRVRQARLELQAVLTNMEEGLVTTDAGGRITLCNPAAAALLASGGDVRGRALTEVLPLRRADGSIFPADEHPLRRALTGERVPWTRLLVLGPQGPLPAALAATPLAGLGTPGAVLLLRDVRAEIEMERIRDDFFFIASHELRTPLTVMQGNLELAVEGMPAGTLRATLEETLKAVRRLIRMVNDFLDAARLDHGAISLRLEDVSLPDLVRQAADAMRPDAERKGLQLVYRPTPGLPAVRTDAERTLQILLNLLGNSVRYTAAGSIEISHEVSEGGVETLIRDTGPGIPKEHHDRLFTRFGQVDRGLTRPSGSTGLGLYIARKLAEQMGGTVVLKHSAPGEGSTFALVLPVAPPGGAGPSRGA
ncbi:MAG: HAMP domain-containing sensor histidine kinase [Armatimonadota bacterium]|nr:HAMP domain-containing sensor histidine kinase [Armatimonadota bacterium]